MRIISQSKTIATWHNEHNKLLCKKFIYYHSKRYFGSSLTLKVIKHLAKFRYLVLGATVGAGITVKQKVEEWKDKMRVFPDLSKVKSAVNVEDLDKASQYVTKSLVAVSNEARNRLTDMSHSIAMPDMKPLLNIRDQIKERWVGAKDAENQKNTNVFEVHEVKQTTDAVQVHDKYAKKIEDLEKIISKLETENELMKRQMYSKKNTSKAKQSEKTLVEMYSEVLDELSNYENGWIETDHLPKVVVVGDQSAGKTSVLEMLAQARIFPRGGGEMMTRTPVKVTLSDGPFHVAKIQGSSKEYDLTKEEDLSQLRKAIEKKMLNSVSKGKTVSKNVISLTVKGPGLHRMVLIDLPGIISTQTADMALDTRDSIREMSQHFMNNPNAIILCIQDGSIDAERSNVTDLVSQCDPTGKRTIFVLTKIDMAEKSIVNPERIRQILSGKLFPMKALGYYAVITGNGNKDDSIENIKKYERHYFSKSKLFNKGFMRSDQVTTENLSKAVAERFWKMIEESIEQQTAIFRAKRFNLETEWKNSFPRKQEMDRDELFYRARGEVLDQGIGLSHVPASLWENTLMEELWKSTAQYVFDKIYFPAGVSLSTRKFNVLVDIALKEWTEKSLIQRSMDCANKTLKLMLKEQLFKDKSSENFDGVYENLKLYVFEETLKRHSWDKRFTEILKVLQAKVLEDKYLTMKADWDDAVNFLVDSLKTKAETNERDMESLLGPSYIQRLYRWQNLNEDQKKRIAVKNELDIFLNGSTNGSRSHRLSREEVIALKNTLENKGVEVNDAFIKETWEFVHRRHFLKTSLDRAKLCKKEFYLYSQEDTKNQIECNDVLLFWRIKKMLKITSNSLRQQIINTEAQRIQNMIREILKEVNRDDNLKRQLIDGRRVTLAEDLKRVRKMQEKLEDFSSKLNEKKC